MKILSKGNYYGQMKMELESKGIILSEYDYLTTKTDWHFHENPYFMYVLQGNVYDVNKKQTAACPTGSFLLHNWDEEHYNEKESTLARGFHIEFERKWLTEKKLDLDLWEGSRVLEDPRLHRILGKIYFEFKCQDPLSEVTIDLLLLQLCEATQNNKEASFNNQPIWVEHLKQILHEDTNNLTLSSLSAKLGVHPAHISRAIPKYLSTTLGDYVRQQKLKKALGLLLDPTLSLTDITYRCGFSDQSHFTRTFKLYFQSTPKNFRKQLLAC